MLNTLKISLNYSEFVQSKFNFIRLSEKDFRNLKWLFKQCWYFQWIKKLIYFRHKISWKALKLSSPIFSRFQTLNKQQWFTFYECFSTENCFPDQYNLNTVFYTVACIPILPFYDFHSILLSAFVLLAKNKKNKKIVQCWLEC